MLRDFYIVSENSVVYPIDQDLVYRSSDLFGKPGFSKLRGGDLIVACIAHLENAYLVTLDKDFSSVASQVRVIDLNGSRSTAEYRDFFRGEGKADAP